MGWIGQIYPNFYYAYDVGFGGFFKTFCGREGPHSARADDLILMGTIVKYEETDESS